jgi:predicted RNA-binding protein with PIN domain
LTHPIITAFQRHLLIDGYNVIHAWKWFSSKRIAGEIDVAIGRLTEAAQVIHDCEEIRVSLVFDGKGEEITVERPSKFLTFSLLYTPEGMTADDLIEQMVGQSKNPVDFLVVTQDNHERMTVESSGGMTMSPDELDGWIQRCRVKQTARVSKISNQVKEEWGNRIDL